MSMPWTGKLSVIKEIDQTYKILYHHTVVCVKEEIEDVDMFDVFNMYQYTYERDEVPIVNFIKKKIKNAKPSYISIVQNSQRYQLWWPYINLKL